MFVAPKNLPFTIEWNGAHYGRVFALDGFEVDVFSFAWEKDEPTQLDFTTALERWLAGE